MQDLIDQLVKMRENILDMPFDPEKSLTVDRLDMVIDWVKEIAKEENRDK